MWLEEGTRTGARFSSWHHEHVSTLKTRIQEIKWRQSVPIYIYIYIYIYGGLSGGRGSSAARGA
jgi:hypothetical protein